MDRNSPLSDAVLLTLAYSDIFSTPLTQSEIHSRLIGLSATPSQVTQTLRSLLAVGRLAYRHPYYFFPDRSHLIAISSQRRLTSRDKLARALVAIKPLQLLPTILAIYLTGSLAANNASDQDDIDLLIVTHPHTLWSTRFVLNLVLDLFRRRRRPHHSHVANRLCLNLYLTPQSFSLPPSKHNLHSAYELIQLKPLYQRQPLLAHLYHHNAWLTHYLPNFSFSPPQSPLKLSPLPRLNFLEPLFFHLQRWYMSPKITRELISPHFAFFHPRSLAPQVTSQLRQRVLRYNITLWPQLRPFLT